MPADLPTFNKPQPEEPIYQPNSPKLVAIKAEIEYLEGLTEQSFSFKMNWREKISLQTSLQTMKEKDLPKAIKEYDAQHEKDIVSYGVALKEWKRERSKFDESLKDIKDRSGNPITAVEID